MLDRGDYWSTVQLWMCRDTHDVEALSVQHLLVVLIERCHTPLSTERFEPLTSSIRSGYQACAGMTGERASVGYRHRRHGVQLAADPTAANDTNTEDSARLQIHEPRSLTT